MEELIEQKLVKDPPEPKLKRKNLERVATGLLCAAGLNLLVNISFNEHYSNKLKALNIQANSKEGPYALVYLEFQRKFLLDSLCYYRDSTPIWKDIKPGVIGEHFERICLSELSYTLNKIEVEKEAIVKYNDKRIGLEEQKSKSLKRAFIYGYFKK